VDPVAAAKMVIPVLVVDGLEMIALEDKVMSLFDVLLCICERGVVWLEVEEI